MKWFRLRDPKEFYKDSEQSDIKVMLENLLHSDGKHTGEMFAFRENVYEKLDRIERILGTLGGYLNELPSKLNRDP